MDKELRKSRQARSVNGNAERNYDKLISAALIMR
ncbi:hypothetical protein SAMN05443252_103456 [Bacillus sp. OV322]|nr:hypothetical protein SAMN05443252_103456 [Bacillus sp. OV322]